MANKRSANTKPAQSPAQQLAGFIAKFDPALAKLVRAARTELRRRFFPTAIELVYDNYNALAVGFGPSERMSEIVVSLAVYARGVNLYFLYGAHLPDPQHILEGSGTQGRFVRLTDLSVLDQPAVQALLREAIAEAEPFPASGKGYIIIKSVSAKQRPRRPV